MSPVSPLANQIERKQLSSRLTPEEFLAELRARGLSQRQLAEELCVSHPAVQQWLAGTTRPSPVVIRLAEYVWTYGKLPETKDNLG